MSFVPPDDTETQWLTVNAIRQAFGIARRETISYEQSVELTHDLAPTILDENSPIYRAFTSPKRSLYRARASARSKIENRTVTPLEIIQAEIDQLQEELESADPDQEIMINDELWRLEREVIALDETNWTETQVIHRDAEVFDQDLPISDKGQGYKEYPLQSNRRLRVRVFHPDPPEARSGVDLMYETHWDKQVDKIWTLESRLVVLQYKMWDGQTLYGSQAPGLEQQMDKMCRMFCEGNICIPPNAQDDQPYRLPYCCAFIRPTDKKQTRKAWQVTRAWHIPICAANKALQVTSAGNKVLYSKDVINNTVTQDIFQELYNRGMLGSRWLNSSELYQLHKQIGIADDSDRVIIHAQEYPLPREARYSKNRVKK